MHLKPEKKTHWIGTRANLQELIHKITELKTQIFDEGKTESSWWKAKLDSRPAAKKQNKIE